jgi:hypothetical protein
MAVGHQEVGGVIRDRYSSRLSERQNKVDRLLAPQFSNWIAEHGTRGEQFCEDDF